MNIYKHSSFNTLISILLNTIKDVFLHPIVVNACLYLDKGSIQHRNWGDDINFFFLKELFKRNIAVFNYSVYSRFLRKIGRGNNYLIIGSTITMLTNEKTIIWGAGAIDPNSPLPHKPQKVLAVRGPLSREYLIKNDVTCPQIYGDPALLLPKVYSPKIGKKYKLGIIPHYDDYNNQLIDHLKKDKTVLFIKMEGYTNWLDIINQILSCEMIASSSLHGLIVAETYGIPNLWINISGNLIGGHFKFHDFFASIGKEDMHPYQISERTTVNSILEQFHNYKKGLIDLQPLIKAAPFPLDITD